MLGKQFFETSRGRIVALLRRESLTVENIASEIGVTTSAIRSLLTAMERDGLVHRVGTRHRGATRPSHLFELTPEVQQLLSRAYVPLFGTLLHVMARRQSAAEINRIMRDTGKALAVQLVPAGRLQTQSLPGRVQAASELLNAELGAVTEVVRADGELVIQGAACPLSALTGKHRAVCLAIESAIKEIVGAPVRECCDRTDRPRCCFRVGVSTT
jgi:DeoR family transcriptional regulator, suf operon transcriptional repressor